jgi:hypothetical protein
MRRTSNVILSLLAAPLLSQEILWERRGVSNLSRVGGKVVSVGDLNGDGCEDLLHIVITRQGNLNYTELWFLSGRDGSVLRVRAPYAYQRPYLAIAGAGDMDGDGVPDYAVAVGDESSPGQRDRILEVRSTRDDALLWFTTGSWGSGFGNSLLGRIDLNGDGRPDLLASSPRANSYGRLYAFAHDGNLLYQVDGTFQVSVAYDFGEYLFGKVGDLDRDGGEDFVVGGFDGVLNRNAAYVLSGRTGRVLVQGTSPATSRIGHAQDGCGDMDGDGVPDFVSGDGFSQVRSAVAFSGRTGQPIHIWSKTSGDVGDSFGDSLSSRGIDLDLDGVPDVVVSASGENQGRGAVYALSGRDGALLWRLAGIPESGTDTLGVFLTTLPAFPGNPFPVVVVCEPLGFRTPGNPLTYLGRIQAVRSSPLGVQPFGSGGRGTLAQTPLLGVRREPAAQRTRVHLSGAEPGSVGVLLLGTSNTSFQGVPLPFALDPLGFTGCSLLVSPDVALVARIGAGSGVASGYAAMDFPLPPGLEPGPVPVFVQWLALGAPATWPGGVTAGLRLGL